jgi:hypothetical protein
MLRSKFANGASAANGKLMINMNGTTTTATNNPGNDDNFRLFDMLKFASELTGLFTKTGK